MKDLEMLESMTFTNYKCFRNQTIPFRPCTIVVGRNNAGKSTIVEGLRLISLVANRMPHLHFHAPPAWAELHRSHRGLAPSIDDLDINFEGVFHRSSGPPAVIAAKFANRSSIELFVGIEKGRGQVHGVVRDARGKIAQTASEAVQARIPQIAILPQVAPVEREEKILSPEYVQRNLSTSLAPRHFRNQINLLHHFYSNFRAIAEETWPGLQIDTFMGHGGLIGRELRLNVRNDDFVAEISWMGHGLQMWLQTIWFIARSGSAKVVMLDEPDVYMHPDLQRRLIRFLKEKFPQMILTTHSVEMLAEVDPREMLIIDRKQQRAAFADAMPTMQRAIDLNLGATHNVQLSRLWGARKVILVEGEDMQILRRFYDLCFPDSLDSLAIVPNFPIGGWGGWNYAVGSSMLLRNVGGEEINAYCVLDSDYHTPTEIEKRQEDAQAKNVRLHVWQRKEIENYLIAPAAIQRTISQSCSAPPTVDEIKTKMVEIAESNKHEVYDNFAESFYAEDKAKGHKTANQRARTYLDPIWEGEFGCLHRVSGKAVLSALSEWSKSVHGVSFGVATILSNLRKEDLAREVVAVLTSIEENVPSQP
jgi:hypothetical protein